jgi:hypothetical protein
MATNNARWRSLACRLRLAAIHCVPGLLLPSSSSAADPLEQMMANIDAGRGVSKDDIRIARFRYLPNSLHDASGVDEKVIGDKVADIKRALHDSSARMFRRD